MHGGVTFVYFRMMLAYMYEAVREELVFTVVLCML